MPKNENQVNYESINDSCDSCDDDKIIQQELGYKQDLHRGLNAFANFAFGYTEVASLVGVCSLYDYGLATGGPAELIWGWILAFGMTMIVAYSLAEICAAYPSAGSVYHWSGQLVPAEYAPLASYACGWTNFLGNAVGDASFAYAWANFLNSAFIASGYDFQFSTSALVAISIIVLFVWSVINCARIDQLGWINTLAAIIHCGSTLLIIVCILFCATQWSGSEFVFTGYYNTTGFQSKPYVYSIGLLFSLWSFSGYEASAHMAQETSGSRTNAPMGIVWTCFASGVGGLGVILALLFTTDDIYAVLNGETGKAAIEVFLRNGGPVIGATLSWILVVNIFFAGMSSVAVTGRITYALSRDGAFPLSKYLAMVHPQLKSPVVALAFVWVMDSILQMLPLINDVAFISITGTATIGFQLSYAIPITLKALSNETFPENTPMSLGRWSKPFGIVSSIWLIGTSLLFLLPTQNSYTWETINYSIFIVAFIFIIGSINWFVSARYYFRGPKRVAEILFKMNSRDQLEANIVLVNGSHDLNGKETHSNGNGKSSS